MTAVLAVLGVLVAVTAVAGVVAWASEPTSPGNNGRAVMSVCPDSYGGVAQAPMHPPASCLSLAAALDAAVSNGIPDDLILLRPGLYCPVALPNTYGRLYLQGTPLAAFDFGGVAVRTHSLVEDVTFASYATDHCATPPGNAVIVDNFGHGASGFVFLQNLSVDGSSAADFTPGTTDAAAYGIDLDLQNAYLRDVVVRHAHTGLRINGGQVAHSAFVDNLDVGVQTVAGRSTWVQDTLIADTVAPGSGAGIGFLDAATGSFAQTAPTLRNVTLTGNEVGLGRWPSTNDDQANVMNTLIAGNGVDCAYAYAGMSPTGGAGHNAVGPSCYGLSTTAGSQTVTSGMVSAIAPVDHLSEFEPWVDPGWNPADYPGDPAGCSPTDQLERRRTACGIGAVSVHPAGLGGPDPVSDWINFPQTLDLGAQGEATAYLSNVRQGLVTVRDVSVTAGFTVVGDDCSLGALGVQAGIDATTQSSCLIRVASTANGPTSGTLTIVSDKGTIAIPLTSDATTTPTDDTSAPDPTGTTTSPAASPSTSTTTQPLLAPDAPGGVVAKAVRRGARVSWTAAARAASYQVQVKGRHGWTTRATKPAGALSATVKGLASGVRVRVRVVAVNAAGSTPSRNVKVRPR